MLEEILISPIDNRDKILLDLGKTLRGGPLPRFTLARRSISVRKPTQIGASFICRLCRAKEIKEAGTRSSLSIISGLSVRQWLSGLYCADFIAFYSPTQLCGEWDDEIEF